METSYKEKYERALAKAKEQYNYPCKRSCMGILEEIFPELAESNDEKIRKVLIKFFSMGAKYNLHTDGIADKDIIAWLEKQELKSNPYSGVSFNYNGSTWGMCARDNGVDISCDKHLIKHLEKQGEQKPEENKGNIEGISPNSAWSEEDKGIIEEAVSYLINYSNIVEPKEDADRIEYLIDKIQDICPHQKQAWNEEDEVGLGDALWAIKQARTIAKDENDMGNLWYAENWLKSLRPQNRWKPSDEQIKVCKEVYADILSAKGFDLGTVVSELNRMEEQLKKLKEK